MTGKILIKRMLSELLSFCGGYAFVERFCISDKAFILMYHRVLASAEKQPYYVAPGMFVSSVSFEKQIVYLKDRYKILFLEDLVEKALSGESLDGFCAITFDDGWRDNYTDAFPVLKKYRVPATIFLATGFVGTERIFWPEEICYYLDRSNVNRPAFDDAPSSLMRFYEEISQYHQCGREMFFDSSIGILKSYSPNERQEILEYFRSKLKTEPFLRQMLNWGEVQEMLASGLVRIGAHTVNHEMLDQLSFQKARDEITRSRKEIEQRIGRKVRTFAYPNGNHNESLQKVLTESGFNAAVTTRKGFFHPCTPLMEIPRIAIHEDVSNTIPMFRSRILLPKF